MERDQKFEWVTIWDPPEQTLTAKLMATIEALDEFVRGDEGLSSILARIEKKLHTTSVLGQPCETAEVFAAVEPPLLSIQEAVRITGISATTFRRAIRDGTIKVHRVGRGRRRPTYRILRVDLDAFLEAGKVQGIPCPPPIPTAKVKKKSRHFD